MNTIELTPADIGHRLASLDALVKSLEGDATRYSYDAVSGDQAAAEKLAEINSEIEGLNADRLALTRAGGEASDRQSKAEQARLMQRRREQWAKARLHRDTLVKNAKRFEKLADELPGLRKAMLDDMKAIRAAVGECKLPILKSEAEDGVMGRSIRHVLDMTQREIGRALGHLGVFENSLRASEVFTRAWKPLDDEVEAHVPESFQRGDFQ